MNSRHSRGQTWVLASVAGLVFCLGTVGVMTGAAPGLAEPANISIVVAPESVAAGERARVIVRLDPVSGVKINRYPKIKLEVPERAGLTPGGAVTIGNDAPPPPDKMSTNYFDGVDPVELALNVSAAAPSGKHVVDGKLTYFYCVLASGFCAPARVPVKIPLTVR